MLGRFCALRMVVSWSPPPQPVTSAMSPSAAKTRKDFSFVTAGSLLDFEGENRSVAALLGLRSCAMTTRRRDTRYQARFPVQVTFGKKRLSLLTEDLSYRGVFLRTDTPPALRQLVRVRIVVPFVGRALDMHGMTVHVVDYENAAGRTPGIGVQFYGLDRDTREAWEATVRHVEASAPLASDQEPFKLPENTPEPIRRRFQRHTAVLTVETPSRGDLDALVTRDISVGGTFIKTEEALKLGAPVMVCLHHPENGSTFILDAAVRHVQLDGVGVEFVGLDDARREELEEFVKGGILVDEELVLEESQA